MRHSLAEEVEFYKGIHQDPPPEVDDRDVILVDFSYKRDVLENMLRTASSITILDHHISAADDLAELMANGAIDGVFDMNRSGAMITWCWFNQGQPAPRLIISRTGTYGHSG